MLLILRTPQIIKTDNGRIRRSMVWSWPDDRSGKAVSFQSAETLEAPSGWAEGYFDCAYDEEHRAIVHVNGVASLVDGPPVWTAPGDIVLSPRGAPVSPVWEIVSQHARQTYIPVQLLDLSAQDLEAIEWMAPIPQGLPLMRALK